MQMKEGVILSHYVKISTPCNMYYQSNKAIKRILIYIGKIEKRNHTGVRFSQQTDFKAGRRYMSKRCGKGFGKTIDFLISSSTKMTQYKTGYREWRIHKTKAEKFFRRLYCVLKSMHAPDEIWELFNSIYNELIPYLSIPQSGSFVISYPYKTAMNQVKNNNMYSLQERNAIARVERAFIPFNDLYYQK